MYGMSREHMKQVWAKEDDMSDLIRRCRTALDMGADKAQVRDMCIQAGQSEEQAFLTYMAAKLLTGERSSNEEVSNNRKVG